MVKKIINSHGRYPGEKIKKSESNILWHYTKYENFKSIMESGELRFSEIPASNDINEAIRHISGYNPNALDVCLAQQKQYKQISLAMDYDSYMWGCMSPMMWGHYANRGTGVCIGIDRTKLETSKTTFHNHIKYKDHLDMMVVPSSFNTNSALAKFIVTNRNSLFFTKTKDWKGENEYRYISNKDLGIQIREAIVGVCITPRFQQPFDSHIAYYDWINEPFEELNKIVDSEIPIYLFMQTSADDKLFPTLADARRYVAQHLDAMENPKNALLSIREEYPAIEDD